ncbi:TetR/AcrR family transcriptional regulator [Planotetraspora kaengkrachanensis]|uniref:TetR family transcriptional regulator n=1 Tax=Planotetraspora kaengkrachanensis TaxID=575193 RepID=A0A8J3LYD7_9ACTN|nr:TetR family transcriptional regulator [Planotetraspora kaengkrachanensis]GIG78688.1 TetR family transcriptional regulator [Planotetraspora kaengkrachanensis]
MDDVEVPAFQRARRPEHRELRRQEILVAAEALLAEMPAEEISLRELGRRLGVSKTHVVRYFESREGVFLGLLDRLQVSWLEALADEWPAPPCEPDLVMRAWADSLAARPILCRLWSLLPSVLERNVSADTVRAYKLAELEHRARLVELLRDRVPALGADDAITLSKYAVVSLVGLWPFSDPTPTVVEATADPRLAGSRVDFAAMYADILQAMLAGLLARA